MYVTNLKYTNIFDVIDIDDLQLEVILCKSYVKACNYIISW